MPVRERRASAATLIFGVALALAFALASTALAGCSHDGPAELQLQLGTGVDAFEPLSDGAEVPLVMGTQGGWHMWVAVRAQGVKRQSAEIRITTHPADAARPRQSGAYIVDLVPSEQPASYQITGLTAIVSYPECLIGREVELSVELTDRTGRTVSDRRIVIPVAGRRGSPGGSCPER